MREEEKLRKKGAARGESALGKRKGISPKIHPKNINEERGC